MISYPTLIEIMIFLVIIQISNKIRNDKSVYKFLWTINKQKRLYKHYLTQDIYTIGKLTSRNKNIFQVNDSKS